MHQLPVPHEAQAAPVVEHAHHQQGHEAAPQVAEQAHEALRPVAEQAHESGGAGSDHSPLHLCLAVLAAAVGLLLALRWIATVRPFQRPVRSRLIDGRMRPRPPPCTTPDVHFLRVLRL
ncbi:hypothetical protein GCM10010470_57930 [Saccharopolyspora taberi]|uniref:Uncharacterized protein n=2 Tax=Saccharopolyspora taberi TaxID=60895 RepID=A0ABN3VKV8_9PSEU